MELRVGGRVDAIVVALHPEHAEGLLDYERTTGEPVAPWALRFAYPFRWFYTVLDAAD